MRQTHGELSVFQSTLIENTQIHSLTPLPCLVCSLAVLDPRLLFLFLITHLGISVVLAHGVS